MVALRWLGAAWMLWRAWQPVDKIDCRAQYYKMLS